MSINHASPFPNTYNPTFLTLLIKTRDTSNKTAFPDFAISLQNMVGLLREHDEVQPTRQLKGWTIEDLLPNIKLMKNTHVLYYRFNKYCQGRGGGVSCVKINNQASFWLLCQSFHYENPTVSFRQGWIIACLPLLPKLNVKHAFLSNESSTAEHTFACRPAGLRKMEAAWCRQRRKKGGTGKEIAALSLTKLCQITKCTLGGCKQPRVFSAEELLNCRFTFLLAHFKEWVAFDLFFFFSFW